MTFDNQDTCVVCGVYVPEGSIVCPQCLKPLSEDDVDLVTDVEEFDETVSFEKIPKHKAGHVDTDRKVKSNAKKCR